MRAHEFVALNHVSSSINDPGEFCVALVDPHGKLWQRSGKNPEVANVLRNILINVIEKDTPVDTASE